MEVCDTFYFFYDEQNNLVIKNEQELSLKIQKDEITYLVFLSRLSNDNLELLSNKYHVNVLDLIGLYCNGLSDNATTNETKIKIKLEEANHLIYNSFNENIDEKKIFQDAQNRFETYYEDYMNKKTQKFYKNKKIPIVSIVGHLNTGKSTLFNYFVKKYGSTKKLSKDFITVNYKEAMITLPGNKKVRLIDSAPLFDSFPGELANVYEDLYYNYYHSDYYIVLEDFDYLLDSQGYVNDTMLAVFQQQRFILVINKIDQIGDYSNFLSLTKDVPYAALISAKDGINVNIIINDLTKNLFNDWKKCTLYFPNSIKDKLYDDLKNKINIIQKKDNENGLLLNVEMPIKLMSKYKDYIWLDNN